MQDANIALKRAKLEHRGHYCYYTRSMGGEMRARVRLMQDLRQALGGGSLYLLFQPQINLDDGKAVGAEALLRWRTESGQLVPPDQFIPLAEDSGLIVAIGDWVLRGACQQLVALKHAGFGQFRMAVNVSVVQFRHPDFIGMLERVIAETGVDPANVELEITESVAMLDPERIVALLNRIKEFGFTVAIDDFGTGFSSLAYLQRLPVDRLKIDRGFVGRIAFEGEGKNIAEMIIDLGRNLGMGVIAEGVEDAAQADYLRTRGCHEAQGFLYARPLDATALLDWLRERGD
jgi:EAL domain-containing protein (putative c-di-GMP-specific phosphodiesterase class I)